MEGYLAAPWFHEMARRGDLGIADCASCKKRNGKLQRQSLGCGYEPAADRVHLAVWQPPSGKNGYAGPRLKTCAGYTVRLPEAAEAVLARAHWSKGNAAVLGPLSKEMLSAILIVEGQYSQLQSWLMTPAKDGGGGS